MSKWKPTGQTVTDGRGQILLVCECTDCGRLANRRHDRVNQHCVKCKPSHPDAARKNGFKRHEANCRKRGLETTLTFKQWCQLTAKDCYYCGREPSNRILSCKGDIEYVCSGIDRVDNSEGYIAGNCVPCCIQCNRAKMAQPLEQFIEMCVKVAKKHGADKL